MKKVIVLSFMILSCANVVLAQINEAGESLAQVAKPTTAKPSAKPEPKPLDGVYEREITVNRPILTYDHIRESDVVWEKRIWRVIPVQEKMNQYFGYAKMPFFEVLKKESSCGNIKVYSDEEFTKPISGTELKSIFAKSDSIWVTDPETGVDEIQVVYNELNWADVKSYRVKEVWFFDKETSTMQVRILGIAPMYNHTDDNGNFRFEAPLFWIYYPHARPALAQYEAYNPGGNDASHLSWEDMLEMRYFASYIYKESNVHDRRIKDYAEGVNALLESDKIHNEIFNYEQDLWVK
jgi:gliding motility associated protien GldN